MTFNVINDGDPVLASPVMQNWRDTNYGSNLTPKDSTGGDVDGTLDIGKADAHWRDAWFGDGTNVVFRVDSTNQRAGVGISVPGADFQVVGSSGSSKIWIGNYTSDDCYAMFYNSGNIFSVGVDHSDNYKFKISDASVVGTNDRLVIDSAGNVGIGTSRPLPSPFTVFNGLHVDGSLTSTLIEGETAAYLHLLDATGTTNQKTWEIVNAGQKTRFRALNDSLGETYNFLTMDHSNGCVGIGMISPSYLLDVATENSGSTNTSAIRNTSNTASSHATNRIQVGGTSAGIASTHWTDGTTNYYAGFSAGAGDFKISTNSNLTSEAFNINATTGSVGLIKGGYSSTTFAVGKSSATDKFEVYGTSSPMYSDQRLTTTGINRFRFHVDNSGEKSGYVGIESSSTDAIMKLKKDNGPVVELNGNNDQFTIKNSTSAAGIIGDTTEFQFFNTGWDENLYLTDSGRTGATEQDWIEVKIGANTGYIRVYASK